jgi:exopolysaccharide production protein ExoQ
MNLGILARGNHHCDVYTGPTPLVDRSTWLTFLFLAAMFFVCEHDLSYSQIGVGNFNSSKADIIAGITEGSITRRIALLSLGLFGVTNLFRQHRNRQSRIHSSLGWILTSLVAWTLLSLIWAEDTALTFKRLVVFGMLCICALAVAHRFSMRETITWTFFSTALFLVIGVFAEMFLGTFHPFAASYRFAGTLHPNLQGINCALLTLSGIAAADGRKDRRTVFRVCALFGFSFLILSASRTAAAATLVAIVVYWCAVRPRATKIALAWALVAISSVSLLVLWGGLIPDLRSAAMLGRNNSEDDSFNGRTRIWEDLGYYINQRPIFGYGYGGFWSPRHVSEISDEAKWGIPDSHSAYFDSLLNLGTVGLFGYALSLAAGIKRAFRFKRLSRNSTFAFCGAFLVFCALDGLLESCIIAPGLLMFLGIVVLIQLASESDPEATAIVLRSETTT